MTYFKAKEIYIDEELPDDRKAETLRHELTHAVIFETQFVTRKKYSEEDVCDLLGMYGEIINSLAGEVIGRLEKEK